MLRHNGIILDRTVRSGSPFASCENRSDLMLRGGYCLLESNTVTSTVCRYSLSWGSTRSAHPPRHRRRRRVR
jgi:hypothetical protein